jgi:hypothetical protein
MGMSGLSWCSQGMKGLAGDKKVLTQGRQLQVVVVRRFCSSAGQKLGGWVHLNPSSGCAESLAGQSRKIGAQAPTFLSTVEQSLSLPRQLA